MKQSAAIAKPLHDSRSELDVASLFAEHRRFLWNLSYRLTGCAADADDIVQETMLRAIRQPPRDRSSPLRPWLAKIALNLGRDLLRRRRRRDYPGSFLPSPVDSDVLATLEQESGGLAYDLAESATFAFLVAAEALTPAQRAVLLLRDVFDYSVREAAHALDMSETNVKVTHLRARRTMASYDRARQPITAKTKARAREALERLLACVAAFDLAGVEALLARDVRALGDGGEYLANRKPVIGRLNVAKLFVSLSNKSGPITRLEWRELNGLWGIVVTRAASGRLAPRFVILADVDQDGKLESLYTVLATRKLTAVAFGS